MCSEIAAEIKSGLATSALSRRLPSARATSLFGGSCSFLLTSADCAPAAVLPVRGVHDAAEVGDFCLAQHVWYANQHGASELRARFDLEAAAGRSRHRQRAASGHARPTVHPFSGGDLVGRKAHNRDSLRKGAPRFD
jgi:hypothetical protein